MVVDRLTHRLGGIRRLNRSPIASLYRIDTTRA